MINKIKNIPDGAEVWVKMRRHKGSFEHYAGTQFITWNRDCEYIYLNGYNEVLTEEQMRERFSGNDGLPKQWDEIEVTDKRFYESLKKAYHAGHAWQWEINERNYALSKKVHRECWDLWYTDFASYFKKTYPEINYPSKKIKKTLAELEKELGYDEGTLEITN